MSPFFIFLWITALLSDLIYPFAFAYFRKTGKSRETWRKRLSREKVFRDIFLFGNIKKMLFTKPRVLETWRDFSIQICGVAEIVSTTRFPAKMRFQVKHTRRQDLFFFLKKKRYTSGPFEDLKKPMMVFSVYIAVMLCSVFPISACHVTLTE